MQWDDSVNCSPNTTVKIFVLQIVLKKFSLSLSSETLTFGQECSQNAVSSISMNVNFSLLGEGGEPLITISSAPSF